MGGSALRLGVRIFVLFTVQLQKPSQQLFPGAYCHPRALSSHKSGVALSQEAWEVAAQSISIWDIWGGGGQGVGKPQGTSERW